MQSRVVVNGVVDGMKGDVGAVVKGFVALVGVGTGVVGHGPD